MMLLPRPKKEPQLIPIPEPTEKPKVFYQIEPLAYSRYSCGMNNVWFVANKRFVPEFTALMKKCGFEPVESEVNQWAGR